MDSSERFQDNSNMLIADGMFNLIWLPKDSYGDLGKWVNWQEAQAYVRTMNSVYPGGFNDFRLPTREEALGFYEEDQEQKDWEGDIVHIHPVFVGQCAYLMWTGEVNEAGQVFRINLRDGSGEFVDKTEKEFMAARLVRSKK